MNLSRLDRDTVTNDIGKDFTVRHSVHTAGPQSLLFPSNSVSTNPVCSVWAWRRRPTRYGVERDSERQTAAASERYCTELTDSDCTILYDRTV